MDPQIKRIKSERRFSDVSLNQEHFSSLSLSNLDNISEESDSILRFDDDFIDAREHRKVQDFIGEMTKTEEHNLGDKSKDELQDLHDFVSKLSTHSTDKVVDTLMDIYKSDILINLRQVAEDTFEESSGLKLQTNFIINCQTTVSSQDTLGRMLPEYSNKRAPSVKFTQNMFKDLPVEVSKSKEEAISRIINRPMAKPAKKIRGDKRSPKVPPEKQLKSEGVQVALSRKRHRKDAIKEHFKKNLEASCSDFELRLPLKCRKSKSETDINQELYISDHNCLAEEDKLKKLNSRSSKSKTAKNVQFYRESLHDMAITEQDYNTWLKKKNWAKCSNLEINSSVSTSQLRSISEVLNNRTPEYQECPEKKLPKKKLHLDRGDYKNAHSDSSTVFLNVFTEISEALLYKELKIVQTVVFFLTLQQHRTTVSSKWRRISQIVIFFSLYGLWMFFEGFYRVPRRGLWRV